LFIVGKYLINHKWNKSALEQPNNRKATKTNTKYWKGNERRKESNRWMDGRCYLIVH